MCLEKHIPGGKKDYYGNVCSMCMLCACVPTSHSWFFFFAVFISASYFPTHLLTTGKKGKLTSQKKTVVTFFWGPRKCVSI